MNNMEYLKKELNEFGGNKSIDTDKEKSPQQKSDGVANAPSDRNQNVNDTSIPFEINGDDEIQQGVLESNYPNDEFKRSSNSIYPHKDDTVAKKDRIPSKIRNDDNPADIDI